MSFEFENVNHFFQEVSQDPELQLQFQSVTDRESLVNTAVALGQERSYNFSSTEVSEWLESMNAQHQSQSDTSGELSDSELDTVAGAGPWGALVGAVGGAVVGGVIAYRSGRDVGGVLDWAGKGAKVGGTIGLFAPTP
ncbi:Nif11-like leader peptide family natural product precursor [Microcoleus sp. LAD1_D3]|uniref:Nif11-like leader peptide family natural product precursor n=1 Tax=Microcoleus sp. LAD1_D3 TaxID=2819365 RepID=UPI002FD58BEA